MLRTPRRRPATARAEGVCSRPERESRSTVPVGGTSERRPKLVGWLIVLIIVLAIIGAGAVIRAIVR